MRAARLRRSSDIARVRGEGRVLRRSGFVARIRRSDRSDVRLAVTAPGSLGGSVARNRARRRVREAFRCAFSAIALTPGVDLLVTARREAAVLDFRTLRDEAASLLGEMPR